MFRQQCRRCHRPHRAERGSGADLPACLPRCKLGCLRLLHRNEQRVVEGIVVELGHRAEVFLEPLGFKQLLDALFQLVRS